MPTKVNDGPIGSGTFFRTRFPGKRRYSRVGKWVLFPLIVGNRIRLELTISYKNPPEKWSQAELMIRSTDSSLNGMKTFKLQQSNKRGESKNEIPLTEEILSPCEIEVSLRLTNESGASTRTQFQIAHITVRNLHTAISYISVVLAVVVAIVVTIVTQVC